MKPFRVTTRVATAQRRAPRWHSPAPSAPTRLIVALAAAVCLAAQAPSAAVEQPPTGALRVRVLLEGLPQAAAAAPDAVVFLGGAHRPAAATASAAPPSAGRIAQRNKTFEPRIEVIPVGAKVAFPNLDRIYHNIFSLSDVSPFDLGLYRNGQSKTVTFVKPGLVRIYCNIHPDMAAFLWVVDSDYFAKTDATGTALLTALPPGNWSLTTWHEKGGEREVPVQVQGGRQGEVTVRLDASGWRRVPHLNKHGKPYPPPDDDENRY